MVVWDYRFTGIVVYNTGMSIDALLIKFNKKVEKSRILKDLKEHSEYKKPSVKRREHHFRSIMKERKRRREDW